MDKQLPRPIKPTKKTSYHHGDLRSAIINAVAQLISEKNNLNFQLKEVAHLVGTSQPAIYKHFAGKADLLVETAVEGYHLQKQFRDHAFDVSDRSALTLLLAVSQAYVYFSQVHTGYFLLMKNLETEEILSSKVYRGLRDATIKVVIGLIQQCIDEGFFKEENPKFIMTSLQSTAYGLAHLYITGQISNIESNHEQDPSYADKVLLVGMDAFMTAKGKREAGRIKRDLQP